MFKLSSFQDYITPKGSSVTSSNNRKRRLSNSDYLELASSSDEIDNKRYKNKVSFQRQPKSPSLKKRDRYYDNDIQDDDNSDDENDDEDDGDNVEDDEGDYYRNYFGTKRGSERGVSGACGGRRGRSSKITQNWSTQYRGTS